MAWPDIVHKRGDTVGGSLKLFDQALGTLDLSGCIVLMTVKPAKPELPEDDLGDGSAIVRYGIEFDLSGDVVVSEGMELGGIDPETEIEVTDAEDGVVTYLVPASVTTTFGVGAYVWDLQVTDATGWVETQIDATWTVTPDAGRRTEVEVEP
jgi:hypothetical protein